LLVVSLGKALNGIALNGQTGSNRWQLDSKNEKVTSLSPGRGNLVNKRAKNYKTAVSSIFSASQWRERGICFDKNQINI